MEDWGIRLWIGKLNDINITWKDNSCKGDFTSFYKTFEQKSDAEFIRYDHMILDKKKLVQMEWVTMWNNDLIIIPTLAHSPYKPCTLQLLSHLILKSVPNYSVSHNVQVIELCKIWSRFRLTRLITLSELKLIILLLYYHFN